MSCAERFAGVRPAPRPHQVSWTVFVNRVEENVRSMLVARGYEILKVVDDQGIIRARRQDGKPVVAHLIDGKFSIKALRDFTDDHGISVAKHVVVASEGTTPFTKRHVTSNKLDVELFDMKEFVTNIVRHKLVPAHRRLEGEERADVMNLWGSCPQQYPRLLRSDPVCRYYAFEVGDLIEIIRTVGYQEPHRYYRVVCEN